jgi:hypothetical protein
MAFSQQAKYSQRLESRNGNLKHLNEIQNFKMGIKWLFERTGDLKPRVGLTEI